MKIPILYAVEFSNAEGFYVYDAVVHVTDYHWLVLIMFNNDLYMPFFRF